MTIKVKTYEAVEKIIELPEPFFVREYGVTACYQNYSVNIQKREDCLMIRINEKFNPDEYYDSFKKQFSLINFVDKQKELQKEFTELFSKISEYWPKQC